MSKSDHSSDSDNEDLNFQVSQNQLIKGYEANYQMYKAKTNKLETQLKEKQEERKQFILKIDELSNRLKDTQAKLDKTIQELQQIKGKEERRKQRNSQRAIISSEMSDENLIKQNRELIQSLISDHSPEDINMAEGDALKAFSRVLKKENQQLKEQIMKIELSKKKFMTETINVLNSQEYDQSLIQSKEGKQFLGPLIEKMHKKMQIKMQVLSKQISEKNKEKELSSEKMNEMEEGMKQKFLGNLYSNLKKFMDEEVVQRGFENFFEEIRLVIRKNVEKEKEKIQDALNEEKQETTENYRAGINYVAENIEFLEDEDAELPNQLPEFDELCQKIQAFIVKLKKEQVLKNKQFVQEIEELKNEIRSKVEELMNSNDQITRISSEKSQIIQQAEEAKCVLEMQELDLSQLRTTMEEFREENYRLKEEIHKMRKQSEQKLNISEEIGVDLFSVFEFLQAYLQAIETPLNRLRAKNQIAWFVTKVIQI